jgi:hypothetical protein
METITQTPKETTASPLHNDTSVPPHHLKNVYPTMRHIILIVLILLAISIIMFLIHQNGRSIYEHGV